MKDYLPSDTSKIAVDNLQINDLKELAESSGFAESTVYAVVKGKKKGTEKLIDLIIDRTKKRLDLNREKLEGHE